ncbi:telomere repeat-binding factor 1-like protein, partial [Trifolium pratense]
RRVFDKLAVVRSPLLETGVLGRYDFIFLNQFDCVSPETDWSNIYEQADQTKMDETSSSHTDLNAAGVCSSSSEVRVRNSTISFSISFDLFFQFPFPSHGSLHNDAIPPRFAVMGAPKQKWSAEEEAALKAGVVKHGVGKWRTILKDPEFNCVLYIRSNVDLKDKWRNLSVMANGWTSREKAKVSIRRAHHQGSRHDDNPMAVTPVTPSDDEIVDVKPLQVSRDMQIPGPRGPIESSEITYEFSFTGFSTDTDFCGSSSEVEDHFKILEDIRGFNVTSANTPDETLPPLSCFLQNDEGETQLDNLIMDAISCLNEHGGSNKTTIAAFIEYHLLRRLPTISSYGDVAPPHAMAPLDYLPSMLQLAPASHRHRPTDANLCSVTFFCSASAFPPLLFLFKLYTDQYYAPEDFKKMLSAKLKYLTSRGKLIKVKRRYRIAPTPAYSDRGRRSPMSLLEGRQRGSFRFDMSRINMPTQSEIDIELEKIRSMSAEEAAAVAARAVAAAEAALAEAEEAVLEAEAAEAEADAAEAFAEAARKTEKETKSLKMTTEGLQWSIGNGRKIRFWNDRWLPSGIVIVLREVVKQPVDPCLENKTIDYFSDNNGGWRLQEASDLIPTQVMNQIFGCTAAVENVSEDKPFWPFSSNGTFTVKTAYELLLHSHEQDSVLWNNVWKWEGPQKIKSFLWRVLNDGLKTNDKRYRCRLTTLSGCPLCSNTCESTLHLFRNCVEVKPVWNQFGFAFNRREQEDAKSWLGNNLNPSKQKRYILFGIIIWCIWIHRNHLVFEDIIFEWQAVAIRARNLLQEVNRAEAAYPHMERSYTSAQVGWKTPEKDWIKVNTDGALILQNQQAGCGGVFRDESGRWLGGFSHKLGSCSALMAEGIQQDLGRVRLSSNG